ncbi:hypothetical protein ACHAXT_007394 [Thalassiosira profunda]
MFAATAALLLSLLTVAVAQLRLDASIGTHHKLVECRHGLFLVNRADTWISKSLIEYGEWAEEEIKLLSHFLSEGDTVADVGANIGTFTVPLAKAVGTKGKVVAFEPQRVVSQLLNANLALNENTNVGVFNAGVGNSNQPLEVPDILYNRDSRKGQGASISLVPQLRLDDVFAADSCPSLIKIDVEEMELMVLKGAEQTLQRCNPVLFLENNCKRGSKELIQYVAGLGYTCHWQLSNCNPSPNFRQNDARIFPEGANSINMLCYSNSNPPSVERAGLLPSISKIDGAGGRFLLHEYGLSYSGKEDTVLSQQGTLESCER